MEPEKEKLRSDVQAAHDAYSKYLKGIIDIARSDLDAIERSATMQKERLRLAQATYDGWLQHTRMIK